MIFQTKKKLIEKVNLIIYFQVLLLIELYRF